MNGSITPGTYEVKTPINAVTATTTSEEIVIVGAKKVTFMFTRANHSSGSSTFSVDVSLDGTTYVDYNKLVTNVANANTEEKVRAASVALAADGSAMASMDLDHDSIYSIKITVTETTDGTHTAQVLIEY